MKNEIKKGLQLGYQLGFVLLLFLPLTVGVSATRANEGRNYPPPAPSIVSQSAGFISFGWTPVSGATGYKVYYVRKETSLCSQEQNTGSEPFFSGLPAGTYKFFFKSVFGSESSDYIVIDDVLIL
jgi:hypothetical protein